MRLAHEPRPTFPATPDNIDWWQTDCTCHFFLAIFGFSSVHSWSCIPAKPFSGSSWLDKVIKALITQANFRGMPLCPRGLQCMRGSHCIAGQMVRERAALDELGKCLGFGSHRECKNTTHTVFRCKNWFAGEDERCCRQIYASRRTFGSARVPLRCVFNHNCSHTLSPHLS